jgi:putative ABC transport system substrate-binding protein
MAKKITVVAMSLAVVVFTQLAYAQQLGKIPRIGFLSVSALSVNAVRIEKFEQSLRELGYVNGKNIVIEWRTAEGEISRLPMLAAELVRLEVDVIVTSGTPSIHALRDATTTIPIVVTSAGDLVGRGLVASLARPGGNITGSTSLSPGLSGKRLTLLKVAVPEAARMAFLYQPYEEDELREIQHAARTAGVEIQALAIHEASQFQSAYASMAKEGSDTLIISRNHLTNEHRRELIDLAVTHRLPTICDGREWVNDGCLMSYAPDRTEGYRRAAVYVDKILKGNDPADLPVGQPTKFELVVNLNAARGLGIVFPPLIRLQTTEVIE